MGTGTVVLNSGADNYSGGTILKAGEFSVASNSNIGGDSSSITFSGGILQITGNTITNLTSHVLNAATFSGGFDVNSAANTLTVTQALSGAGSSTKLGAGTLILTGANTYSGETIDSAGVLQVGTGSTARRSEPAASATAFL